MQRTIKYKPIMDSDMFDLLQYAFNVGVVTGLKMVDSDDTFLAYREFKNVMEYYYEHYDAGATR